MSEYGKAFALMRDAHKGRGGITPTTRLSKV